MKKLLGTAAVLAVAALTLYWIAGARHEDVTMQASPSASISLLGLGNEPLRQPAPVAAPPRVSLPPTLTKSQEVDRLGHSANPIDNYRAYKMVRACLDAAPNAKQAVCGDISPGQTSAETRMLWLVTAAKAGVWHSFVDVESEGPSGLGHTLNPPPAVVAVDQAFMAEVQTMVAAAEKSGDPEVLLRSIHTYLSEGRTDQAVALAYAMDAITTDTHHPLAGRILESMTPEISAMTPEQLTAAQAQGASIAAAAKQSPYYGSL